MLPQDRLAVTATVLKEYNPDSLDVIDDYSVEDIAKIAGDFELKPDKMPQLIGIMIYIRHRLIEKKSRVAAFRIAFPERCVFSGVDSGNDFASGKDIGEEISKSAIDIKAKRLENSQLYMHVYSLLQTNLYISYAVDRMKVLDEALDVALDPLTPLRDKDRYMKLFLDETRKPESAKGLEVNFNLTNNNVSLASVEDKMNTIAQALNHASAGEIIDIIHQGPSDDN